MKTKEKLLADINKICHEVDDLYFKMSSEHEFGQTFDTCALKALYNFTSIRKLRILKKYAQGELDRAREMKDETWKKYRYPIHPENYKKKSIVI